MQRISTVLGLVLALIISLASVPAFAGGPGYGYGHGSYYGPRVGVGVYFGGGGYYSSRYPYYYPPYYAGPGYYYPPAVIAVPSAPITYIEQAPQAAPQPQQAWWYYCSQSNAYFPYVKECTSGWQRVAPVPPPQG